MPENTDPSRCSACGRFMREGAWRCEFVDISTGTNDIATGESWCWRCIDAGKMPPLETDAV